MYDEHITTLAIIIPYFMTCREDQIGYKFLTFYPSSYLSMWYVILFGFIPPFKWCVMANGYT